MSLRHTRPNASLLRELGEVARDANVLLDYLNSANTLPLIFPTVQLLEIAHSLSDLPKGTAEGCRGPLEYARVRLPAMRREFILNEDESVSSEDNEAPSLVRGMTLDRLFRDLIASVTTALDEYRRQTTESYDDSVGPEPFVDDTSDRSVLKAIRASRELEASLQTSADLVAEAAVPESVKMELFHRRLKDAESINRVARAELQMRTVVLRWFRGAAEKLSDYPALLREAGQLIDATVDVLKPLSKRWHRFWEEFSDFGLEQLRATSETLIEVANTLDKRKRFRSVNVDIAGLDSERVRAEREARELILAGFRVPKGTADLVENLSLAGVQSARTRIPNVSLLSDLHNLRNLDVRWSDVSKREFLKFAPKLKTLVAHVYSDNLSFLRLSDSLEALSLTAESVEDISSLSKLQSLTRLTLIGGGKLRDLSPLEKLTGLVYLSIAASEANDVSFLRKLERLASLRMQAKQLIDLSPLSRLTALQLLTVHAPLVADLTPLAGLTNLERLIVQTLEARNLEPLGALKKLNSLSLNCGELESLAPLGGLSNIGSLNIRALGKLDFSPLIGLSKLESLTLQTLDAELSTLPTIENLTSLKVQGFYAEGDLSKISASFRKLTNLNVQTNLCRDLYPLSTLHDLVSLTLAIDGPVVDMKPLSELRNLKYLVLRGSAFQSLESIKNLKSVEVLDIRGTGIRDIRPLASWKRLADLNLAGLEIRDLSPIRSVQRVRG